MSDKTLPPVSIKVMPFLQRKGNRVAKGALEFSCFPLTGMQMVGFTICDDKEKGLFVLFPSSIVKRENETKPYFFLRPSDEKQLDTLSDAILDVYESMVAFNRPRVAPADVQNVATT